MKPYKLISHTADIGVRVKGRTLKELFENSAFALFDIIADLERVKEKERFILNLTSGNQEELLHDWLRELLFQCNVNLFVCKKFQISKLNNTSIESTAVGEHITSKDVFKTEIKAVTYHNMVIKKEKNTWKTNLIFDV
ncbi:MAG: archease [Candidatus Omnitrophica bacterium]|nr:archease [Candidatus Omnitrophota bacterium]